MRFRKYPGQVLLSVDEQVLGHATGPILRETLASYVFLLTHSRLRAVSTLSGTVCGKCILRRP
jgi:hypothetical protein